MAEVGGRTRVAGWLLLGMAAVALDGCFERHEPANPFIGPFGDAEEGSFAERPAGAPRLDQASAAGPALTEILLVQVPWVEAAWVELPRWAQADAQAASSGTAQP